MAFYKVVGLKTYDPHHANLSKFIGRKCQLMSDTKINADGSRSGQLGFPDEYKIYIFEGVMLAVWPETPKDEEDIL